MVAAPIRLLPIFFEEIAFRDVGTSIWGHRAQFIHAAMNSCAGFTSSGNVWFVAENPGIPATIVCDNGQRKGAQDRGIRRGVARGLEGLARPARKSLIEMQLDVKMPRTGKQRIRQPF